MIENAHSILVKLDEKFRKNLEISAGQHTDTLSRAFLKARVISELGMIIKDRRGIKDFQIEIVDIFDEIFADIITSIYFASSGLDKPAQMILRRVIELGIAIVYLWDLPHVLYSWKYHDMDLNFNEMLKHLKNEGYLSYLKENQNVSDTVDFVNTNILQSIYRELSNTVHGKISTFETNIEDRFDHNSVHWKDHLNLVENIGDELIHIFFKRYSVKEDLLKRIPAYKNCMEVNCK